MTDTTQVTFTPSAYRQITRNLDAVLTYMMTEFGKTEDEAQAWMRDFIADHYFPVWRRLNRDDLGALSSEQRPERTDG